ncbi:MAG: hypothetical protein KAI26_05685, partial [Nanoarchaeota archaeon]|nr:hypothetical protein [Nanoarchaeota archaeon]
SLVFTSRQEVDNRQDKITVVPVVKAVFEVFVPYPGKYLEYNMSIESANSRQPVKIIFPLSNKGSSDFETVYADVEVSGVMKKTEIISVDRQKQAQLLTEFDSLVPGSYNAKAVLYYEGESAEFEKEFDYGEWIISIQDIRVEDFTLGDFADFDIVLKNNWNKDAEEVIADLIITDMRGYKYTSVTSFGTIPAQGSAHFSGYWDSYNATPGEYYLTLKIYYSNLTKQYSPKITVEKNRIVTQYYAPPEPIAVSFYKKLIPDKYRALIKDFAYPILALLLLVLFFFMFLHSLTLIEYVVGKISLKKKPVVGKVRFGKPVVRKIRFRKPRRVIGECIEGLLRCVLRLYFIDYLMKKKRTRRLRMLKKRYVRAIVSARDDLLIMKRAIDGLYYNLETGIINEIEFDKRLQKILDGKSLKYWEDYYTGHIIRLEGKIKQVNKQIWEEG